MKTFQDIEIAREMQNMLGYPQRVIKPWQYQFTREDFYHPDEVRGCRWAIRDETKPKEPRGAISGPLWLRLASNAAAGAGRPMPATTARVT
jgi:hypothetical protein